MRYLGPLLDQMLFPAPSRPSTSRRQSAPTGRPAPAPERTRRAAAPANLFSQDALEPRVQGGRSVRAPVVNEHQVRAAAGTTMVLAAVAFGYAYFEQWYLGLQVVSLFFAVEFGVRVSAGISRSPVGVLAGWMTRRQPPDWVSAKPKRFAWSLGLAMAGAMAVITNVGIRGWLPRSICLVCLTLMWLESALGLCLGCEIHGQLVRRGWARKDEAFEICAHGACDVTQPGRENPVGERGRPAGVTGAMRGSSAGRYSTARREPA